MTHVLFLNVLLICYLFCGECYENDIGPTNTETISRCKQFYQHEELHVNCSYKNLRAVPDTPADTVYLYLKHNLIRKIPNKTFDHLNILVALDLSFNRIIAINEDSFSGPQNLQSLNLNNNVKYHVNESLSLPNNVFKHLVNLTFLDLSYNHIDSIHQYTFNGLLNLQHLKLSNNWLEEIPNDTFLYTPSLSMLDLFYNTLYSVTKRMFTGLKNLHHLDLNGNFIDNIKNNAFQPLINLTVLNLEHNYLNSVNKQMFAGLPKLRCLNLSLNHMNKTSNHTFEHLTDLRSLDLSNNKLQSLNERTFMGLKNLEVLRLNLNSIMYNKEQLPPGCFKPLKSLRQLSIQMNNCPLKENNTFIFPDETIKDLKMLEMLELDVYSVNETILGKGFSTLHNLSTLIFSGSCIFSLYNGTFRYTLNFTHFSSINCNIIDIENGTFFILTKLKFVQLDFLCFFPNKRHYVMDIIFSLSKTPIEILKINNVYIGHLIAPWKDINVLLLDTLIRELHITNNDGCFEKRLSFPLESFIPAPKSLQLLDLSNNAINQISLNLTYIMFLDLSSNALGQFVVENSYAMMEISRTEYISLSNNSIEHIFSKLFLNQPHLRNIDLSFNKLTDVSFNLSHLEDLKILNLSSNTIRFLDDTSMRNIDRLLKICTSTKVDLSNNVFQCNCDHIPFLNWTWSRRHRFINFDAYTCSFDNGSIFYLNSIEANIIDLQRECLNYSISMIITCSAIFVFIVILAIIGIHRHRQKLRFLLYTFRGRLHFLYYKTKFKNRFRSTKHSENKLDYIYDAFVSYSDDDREFVLNDCIEHIENDGNLKLCVHHRDFVPGEDITDNIIHAIESSRKTICIITRSFLQSYYCMFEYNMARMESIHSRNGKNVLFLVFYEQLLPEELPLVLYEVIQKQTYIEFPNDEHGNMIFWEKIKDGISA